jgi:hypothetical protein
LSRPKLTRDDWFWIGMPAVSLFFGIKGVVWPYDDAERVFGIILLISGFASVIHSIWWFFFRKPD